MPLGFSTCSPACTVADRAGEPRPNAPVYDTIPEGLETIDSAELARRLGLSRSTVQVYKHTGRIPSYQVGPREVRYNYEAVCKALGRDPQTLHDLPGARDFTGPAEVRIQVQPGFLKDELPPGRLEYRPPAVPWIDRALAAAKEAFRDVVLEVADEAKARGDHLARAEALDDYVFFEEGLKLVYQRREERHA